MTQDPDDESSFTVASGETVTVTVDAVHCNCDSSAAFDGAKLAQPNAIPNIYSFRVNGASGTGKVFGAVFNFLQDDPDNAHYTVQVSGSEGTEAFDAPDGYKKTPKRDYQLFFTIA
jgi:hypothetical protein